MNLGHTMTSLFGVPRGCTKLLVNRNTYQKQKYYDQFDIEDETDVFCWDDKSMGCKVLLAELTGKNKYINAVQSVCDDAITRKTSPGGEVWWGFKWGSLRYAANSALICLQAADIVKDKHDEYLKFAQEQI